VVGVRSKQDWGGKDTKGMKNAGDTRMMTFKRSTEIAKGNCTTIKPVEQASANKCTAGISPRTANVFNLVTVRRDQCKLNKSYLSLLVLVLVLCLTGLLLILLLLLHLHLALHLLRKGLVSFHLEGVE